MYAQLGSVTFKLKSVNGMEMSRAYNYAEHEIINGKPVLQFTGEGLEQLTLGIELHWAFCEPSVEIKRLHVQAESHEILPMTFASGEHAGNYVLCNIQQTVTQTDSEGRLVFAAVILTLKECPEKITIQKEIKKQMENAPGIASGLAPVSARSVPTSAAGFPRTNYLAIVRQAAITE